MSHPIEHTISSEDTGLADHTHRDMPRLADADGAPDLPMHPANRAALRWTEHE